MSTRTELNNNPKSFLRKVNKNNRTLTINIPLILAERNNIHANDYMLYEDSRNKITLRKINIDNINTEEKEIE